jgi:hypothetical protein
MNEEHIHGLGALESPQDPRTFTYSPATANLKGGERWKEEDIEDQHSVGICTAISLVMRAQKHFGRKFSPDFQYLCQKKFYDNNWDEGSSIFYALKVGKNIGFLPIEEFVYLTEDDRKLPYNQYIEKLKAIPDSDIELMKERASRYKLSAYASVPVDRDFLANAIDETGALLTRFVVGSEWWTAPIEPLRAPVVPISGHAVNLTNYNGNSFRNANSWGIDWADKGTAYFLFNNYKPTEAWSVWFEEVPPEIEEQINALTKQKIVDVLNKLIESINEVIKVVNN